MGKFYNLKTFLQGLQGGHFISKDIVIGFFNYAEQNSYLKILIGRFLEKAWHGRGPSCPPFFWSFNKSTRSFHYRYNEPSSDILGQLCQYKKKTKKNTHTFVIFLVIKKNKNPHFYRYELETSSVRFFNTLNLMV